MQPYGIGSALKYETEPKLLSARAYEKRLGEKDVREQLEDAEDPGECFDAFCAACNGPCSGLG